MGCIGREMKISQLAGASSCDRIKPAMGMTRVQLINHMSNRELVKRYESAGSDRERKFWRSILLYAGGKTLEEVGVEVGMSRDWVAKALEKYNAKGPLAFEETLTIQEQKAHIAKLRALGVVTVNWIQTVLQIDYKTFIKYENGEKEAKPRVLKLLRKLVNGEAVEQTKIRHSKASREERFIRAMHALLGEKLLKNGFAERDSRKSAFVKILEDATGISYRTLYRYLPPYDADLRVKESLTRAVEDAAESLGKLDLSIS